MHQLRPGRATRRCVERSAQSHRAHFRRATSRSLVTSPDHPSGSP
jgi:hypothetical protein